MQRFHGCGRNMYIIQPEIEAQAQHLLLPEQHRHNLWGHLLHHFCLSLATQPGYSVSICSIQSLYLDWAKLPESLREALVSEVPGHPTKEDFSGIERGSLTPSRGRQLTRPGASSLTHWGGSAILLCGPFQGKGVGWGVEGTRKRSTSGKGWQVVGWDELMATKMLPWIRGGHARQAKQGLQQVRALNTKAI